MNEAATTERPSKSQRKRDSEALQELGEALIELPQEELDALALPEVLHDALMLARRITKHGGLYRQRQYIGKLMRKIDAEPIRAALQDKRLRQQRQARHFHRLEHYRAQLLEEGPAALRHIAPGLPAAQLARLTQLTERARRESTTGGPRHAARELFRTLAELLDTIPR